MSFWQSPLVKNLEAGKLPEVEVTLDTRTIVNLCLGIAVAGAVIVLVWAVAKRLV